MAARGKLKERSWRRGNGDPATIDDITVLVIPILPYKQEQDTMVKEDSLNATNENGQVQQVIVEVVENKPDEGMEAMEVEKEVDQKESVPENSESLVTEKSNEHDGSEIEYSQQIS